MTFRLAWYRQVHRRLVEDDGCGLGEALNDTSMAIGRHLVHLGTPSWTFLRDKALQAVYAPVLAYAKAKKGTELQTTLSVGNVGSTLSLFSLS